MPAKREDKKKSSSMTRAWFTTAVLAVAIIGGAFVISRQNQARVPVPAPAPEQHAGVRPEPLQPPAAEMPPAVPPPQARPETPQPRSDAWKQAIVQKPEAPAGNHQGEAGLLLDNLAGTLKLSVPVLTARENRLPLVYTCYRANVSPPLAWTGAPPETQSFVLFLEKRQEGENPFVTWIIFNIPSDLTALDRDLPKREELDNGIRHATSDAGIREYSGPCEPRGQVNFAFRLFALDTVLESPAGISRENLIQAMNGHIIDAADVPFIHYLRF